MESTFTFMNWPLLLSIVILTSIVVEVFQLGFKIELSRIKKMIVTALSGLILSIIWFKLIPDQNIGELITTFLAAIGFYDFFISTIRKEIGDKSK